MGVHARFALSNRTEIENEIERLIAMLDAADAPSEDLEPELDYCLAGDDDCGETRSIAGGYAWGSHEEAGGSALPRYGLDQSLGPVNTLQLEQEHRAMLLGLVRREGGGWRRAP